MQRFSAVLDSKVQIPHSPRERLLRPHLLNGLHEHADRKLQFVIAPAGFGKTTLLVDFAHDAAFSVCWSTLDGADRDLATFLETIVAAIRRVVPGIGEGLLAALEGRSELESQASALARQLVLDFQRQGDPVTILVLDDYHEVDGSAAVTQFVNELLRLLPDNLRIVLASRTLPSLTISRLLVEEQIFGLGEADLRFSAAELITLLQRRGHRLTEDQASAFASGAEGWIAGFLLSVPQIWEGLVGGMIAAGGGDSPLYNYLAAEAFDRQPAAVQRFLLHSSVPERVDDALATALLGVGWQAHLDEAERAGLFVTRLPQGAFRYHQLFRDFLQTRLRRTNAAEYARLHRLVADHLAAAGAWPAALTHLKEAQVEGEAAALLARIAPELERTSRWRTLADAVAGLSAAAIAGYPQLMLSGARAALQTADLPQSESLSERVRDAGEASGDHVLEAWGLMCLGYTRRLQGRTAEALALFEQALLLAEADQQLMAIIRRHIGKAVAVKGDYARAAAMLREALTHFDRTGATYDAAQSEFGLGVVLAKSGRVGEAIACYESALTRWRSLGDLAMEAEMLNCLGCAHAYRGEYERARAELQEALERAYDGGYALTQAATLHSLSEVLLAAGEVPAARNAIEKGLAIAKEIGESWIVTHLYDALALTTAFEGDLLRAEEHAHHAIALARRQESRYVESLCSVTLGAIGMRLGRSSALGTLRDAATALQSMEARREAAHANLWLAQAQLHAGDRIAARQHLDTALQLAGELGSDGTLDVHARWDTTLFEQFSSEGVEPERLQAALARVGSSLPPSTMPPSADLPDLTARAFGPGVLLVDGKQEVAWAWDKTRELFFFLLHSGPRRREQIVDALWPDSTPDRAKAALHTSVYRLRRAVDKQVLILHDGVYRINEELITHYDARELERLMRMARDARGEEAVSLLREAAELYTAPFLEDLRAEWCTAERDRLEREHAACLEALIDAEADAGRWRESIVVAERLLALDPLREEIHARIIRAYLRLGDHGSARRQFERCAAILKQELSVEPGAELQALQRRIQ